MIVGSVGRWVGVWWIGGSVGKGSVGKWSLDLIKPGNSYLKVNKTQTCKFKDLDNISSFLVFLESISKVFSVNRTIDISLYCTVCDCSNDYGSLVADDILHIHEYMLKKHSIKCYLGLSNSDLFEI